MMEIWSCTFLAACGSIFHQKISKKSFCDRVVSHFQDKVGSTSVLSGKHMVLVTRHDAGWNSTQHPSWPRALSNQIDPHANNWWIGLWCFGVTKYWGKSINMGVPEPQLLKWTKKWVFNAYNYGYLLGGKHFHPASLRNYDSDTSLSVAYCEFIFHLLK